MKGLGYKLLLLLLGLCMALNPFNNVMALDADFDVRPSRIDLMIKPGQKVLMTFKVSNYGDPHTFTPRIINAAPDQGTGILTPSRSLRTPVSFTFQNSRRDIGEPVFLKTSESANVPVTIETNSGEQKDYYYYFLTEAQQTGLREGKTSIQLTPRIAVPLVITLTNTAEREVKGAISVFRAKADYSFRLFGREINLVETGTGVPVYLTVSNTGNSFISPQGKITLRNSLGAVTEYPVIRRNIYAQSARLMLTEKSYEKNCSDANECKRSSLFLHGFLIGQYDLSASMDLGTDASKSFKTASFFAFPFKPALTVILFTVLYTFIMRRHRKARHRKKS